MKRGLTWDMLMVVIGSTGPSGALASPTKLRACVQEIADLPTERWAELTIVEWRPSTPNPFVFIADDFDKLLALRGG